MRASPCSTVVAKKTTDLRWRPSHGAPLWFNGDLMERIRVLKFSKAQVGNCRNPWIFRGCCLKHTYIQYNIYIYTVSCIYIYTYIQDMINKALFNPIKTIVQKKFSWMFHMCHSRVTWNFYGAHHQIVPIKSPGSKVAFPLGTCHVPMDSAEIQIVQYPLVN